MATHLVLASLQLGPSEAEAREHQRQHLEHRATVLVHDCVAVLGRSLFPPRVRAESLGQDDVPFTIAMYDPRSSAVVFNADLDFTEDWLLATAGHECSHFLSHNAGIYYGHSGVRNIEETVAAVLGAHIAGRARTARGGDGKALTERLLSQYRVRCDPSHPRSDFQIMERSRKAFGPDSFTVQDEIQVYIHCGGPALIDRVGEICEAAPTPWSAMLVIARDVMRLEPRPPGWSGPAWPPRGPTVGPPLWEPPDPATDRSAAGARVQHSY